MSTERIDKEAAAWLIRQRDDSMDWDGFTVWLESDPRHRQVFDEYALIDSELDAHAKSLAALIPLESHPASADERTHDGGRLAQPWRRWGVGALAASIAVIVGVQFAPPLGVQTQSYTAPTGQVRTVVLPEGITASLAPGSTMSVRGAALTLNGKAYFDVQHRAARALTIQLGDFQVHDIGTRFTAGTEDGNVEIEVASGTLSVSSAKLDRPIDLVGGRAMFADGTSGKVRLAAVEAMWVGSWRTGKLHFDNVPLAMVARDISRYSGTRIIVDPAIAGRAFSGVIVIDDKRPPAQTLADIMALEVRPVHRGLRLQPRDRR
jgi:transmembrane sensor